MHIKLVAINGRYTHSSLALFHLRNELEEYCSDITIEIFQFSIRDPGYEILLRLSHGAPDAILFSAAIWNSDQVERLIVDLHSLLPSSLLVVGGPQAEVVARNLGPGLCTAVRGAIESVEECFYSDLQGGRLQPFYGRSFFHIPEKQKKFISPYRDEDFSSHLKNRNIYYESSRGCPFACSYCLSSAENGMVHKDLTQVRRELDQIMVHAPKVLRFVDRTFNDLPGRALALWQLVLEYDGDTLFHFEIAPDRISEEMFTFLTTVPPGRFQFEIGIQSTHEPTLAAINRRINPENARKTVSRLVALNTIHLHVDLILGLPQETKESFLQSFADVFGMGPHYIQMGLLKLLPDTVIACDALKFSYRACSRPPYSVLANQWMDAECLQNLYWFSECVEKFCNNRYFPSIWNYFRETGEAVIPFFQKLLEVSRKQHLFQLAVTQEFLCTILTDTLQGRGDYTLLQQLLSYDWLRCGHRTLPPCLELDWKGKERALRDLLYQRLPQSLPGVYMKSERSRFIKQSVFREFSRDSLQCFGFQGNVHGEERVYLVFLRERDESLCKYNKVVVLDTVAGDLTDGMSRGGTRF
ncbi:MAG: DUF4080 domain-containing protein [Desulfocapsa sp.]|nr:DUF4080 domain-containing protein [Desulfocapsa sp.]